MILEIYRNGEKVNTFTENNEKILYKQLINKYLFKSKDIKVTTKGITSLEIEEINFDFDLYGAENKKIAHYQYKFKNIEI